MEDAGDADFEVLEVNWETVRAFCLVQTQWRHITFPGGGCHYTGLDYAACQAALTAAGVDFSAVFAGLRIMEAAVLEKMSE